MILFFINLRNCRNIYKEFFLKLSMVKKGVKKSKASVKKISNQKKSKSSKGMLVLCAAVFIAIFLLVNSTNFSMTGNAVITGQVVEDGEDGTPIGNTLGGAVGGITDWFERTFISGGADEEDEEVDDAERLERDTKIMRNVLWVMILLFIFTVFLASKWPPNRFFAFFLAAIASYLGSFVITDDMIRSIILSYGALFAAIAVVIPFFVLILFSSSMLVAKVNADGSIKSANLGMVVGVWLLWVFYDIYLIYFLARSVGWFGTYLGTVVGSEGFKVDTVFIVITGAVVLVSFFLINFRKSRLWLARFGRDLQREVQDIAIEKVGYYKQLDAATTAAQRVAGHASGTGGP